jgi:DNA-directed RNA polymerase subunit RPC12/RpoP
MSALADWLARRAPAWLDGSRPVAAAARRALHAIARCRTPALGGHRYRCADCGGEHHAFHSCHHRACPRCGGQQTAAWTARQTERLLPVPYFLVTCTVPAALRPAFAARPEVLHDVFFAQAAAAVQAVAALPRHLGAELGMLGVLHTWGRQMQHHPHLHFIVPGGGLRPDRKKWRRCRRPDWLLPGEAVAAALRRGFDEALRAAAPDLHAQIGEAAWRQGWWVHIQPAGSGENVVKYLARYVGRTAISDERIVAADDEAVTFRYRDSATQQARECTLDADEFLRRYLQHVPPPGQHRVRYFGWMHPAAKQRRLIVETLLAVVIVVRSQGEAPPPWHLRCPHCGAFALVWVGSLPRGPPRRP